jgi:predicted RNA-binding protein with EMAP domain
MVLHRFSRSEEEAPVGCVRMKISLDWLSDFVTWIEKDPQAIANRITLGSAEVEEMEEQGKFLAHCCVGKVLTAEKHPNADRLTICTVDTDDGVKTVVCGGTNVVCAYRCNGEVAWRRNRHSGTRENSWHTK